MITTDKAINFFRAGYSCSQSVLMACAGESDSASRTAGAFGKGVREVHSRRRIM